MSRPNNLTINDQWSAIRREDDGTSFVAAVINIKAEDMALILKCKDRRVPENIKEAKVLAVAHLYAGVTVSTEIFEFLGNKLPANPPRRRLYTNLPWCEKKNTSLEFARRRDQELGMIHSNGDFKHGSLSHDNDHADDALRAGRVGIPQAGVMAEQPDPEDLQKEIDRLKQELQTERANFAAEVARHRNTEANRQAEVSRFNNEQAHRMQVQQRLADEQKANEDLRRRLTEARAQRAGGSPESVAQAQDLDATMQDVMETPQKDM